MKKYVLILSLLFIFFLILPAFAENNEKTKYIKVEVLAYCYNTSRTATGSIPNTGTIAVDPKIIPLGSKIYVPGYGWGKALDTGYSIKGNMIDIWLPTYEQCIKWGRKKLTITVVTN